ncbi:MAG: hypothetical protein M3174_03005 [Actinomycetota bacterium]|nr:hypothetical protein [Actinomycetota bacterium]
MPQGQASKTNRGLDVVAGAAKLPARLRLRYRLDNLLAAGTRGLAAWLVWATIALILTATIVSTLLDISVGGSEPSFVESLWQNFLRTLDPGTMGADVGWPLRLVSLFVTIGGVLIVSTLIGLLANGVGRMFEDLDKGRSIIAENDHIVILGWSTKIHTLLSELVVANRDKSDATVAILAPNEKARMEQEIETRLTDPEPTKIVVRSGVPYEESDLRIVTPQQASALVLLRPEDPDGDAFVVRTALALLNLDLVDTARPCIAEIKDPAMAQQLKSAIPSVHVIQSQDIMARITAQVCRQPGLSSVYQDLLDFEGDEIYFHSNPALVGNTFSDAVFGYRDAAVLGLMRRDGMISLSPPADAIVEEGDRVILLAGDIDTITFARAERPEYETSRDVDLETPRESFLIMGWSSLAPAIVRELDAYVASDSTVEAWVSDREDVSEEVLARHLANLTLSVRRDEGDTQVLEDRLTRRPPDHVLLLCERDGTTPAVADAKALMTLLHARRVTSSAENPPNIVAELLDERDVRLVPSAGTEEFIVSERLTSLLMAQIAEDGERGPVFEDLLNPTGVEIYVKPAELYVRAGDDPTFGEVVASALARGEIALGYRVGTGRGSAPEVVINPNKSSRRRLGPGDGVVVLAQTET